VRSHWSSRVTLGKARRVWPATGASGAVSSPVAAAMADRQAADSRARGEGSGFLYPSAHRHHCFAVKRLTR
jgi:hypothetical protein